MQFTREREREGRPDLVDISFQHGGFLIYPFLLIIAHEQAYDKAARCPKTGR